MSFWGCFQKELSQSPDHRIRAAICHSWQSRSISELDNWHHQLQEYFCKPRWCCYSGKERMRFPPPYKSLSPHQCQDTVSAPKHEQRLVNRGSPQCWAHYFSKVTPLEPPNLLHLLKRKPDRNSEINVFDFSVCYPCLRATHSLTYPCWKKTGVRPQGLVCHLWKSTKTLSAS